ncbi:hypothetical protein [Bisbaumannia pacifica]|uniref:DUF4376 domain-containing protein n=1 Tax=Bisbaumannia pacifica TaxID=77098 RepID=A0ABD4L006_9GAMM|nr:hypothetical protein [Halomonas pacifica]MBH8578796.1 hypothetical protein [Halomonas pacifica]
MYVETGSGTAATLTQIRKANPSVSLPRTPSDSQLAPLGYAVLHATERPEGDVVSLGIPEQRDDGHWYQTWQVRDFTPDELAQQLEDARESAIERINAAYTSAVAPLVRDYPEPEPLSWAHQDAEARAYLEWHAAGEQGTPPATPVLEQILAGRNEEGGTETMLELCQAVEANAEQFRQAQVLTGRRQRLVGAVRDAQSLEEVDAISW